MHSGVTFNDMCTKRRCVYERQVLCVSSKTHSEAHAWRARRAETPI